MKNRTSSHFFILVLIVVTAAIAHYSIHYGALVRGYETSPLTAYRNLLLLSVLALLATACHGPSAPTPNVAGKWVETFGIPGASLVLTLDPVGIRYGYVRHRSRAIRSPTPWRTPSRTRSWARSRSSRCRTRTGNAGSTL